MSFIEPIDVIDVIAPRLRELWPSLTEVEVRRSTIKPEWQVRVYDATHDLATEEHIDPHEFRNMIEKDGTGWRLSRRGEYWCRSVADQFMAAILPA